MKKSIIIFSILYILSLIIGVFFQSIIYFFIINGIFSISSLWLIFFISQNKQSIKNTVKKESIEDNINPQSEKNILTEEKTQPQIIEKEIYDGEIISDEVFEMMEEDRKTWFNKTNKRIEESLSDMKKILNGE